MTAIEHINYRRAWDAGAKSVGKFYEGTSVRRIKAYVDEALAAMPEPSDQNSFSYIHDFGDRIIGVGRKGLPSSLLQIHVRDGRIMTAFPKG